jgi:hypothetical protein
MTLARLPAAPASSRPEHTADERSGIAIEAL